MSLRIFSDVVFFFYQTQGLKKCRTEHKKSQKTSQKYLRTHSQFPKCLIKLNRPPSLSLTQLIPSLFEKFYHLWTTVVQQSLNYNSNQHHWVIFVNSDYCSTDKSARKVTAIRYLHSREGGLSQSQSLFLCRFSSGSQSQLPWKSQPQSKFHPIPHLNLKSDPNPYTRRSC